MLRVNDLTHRVPTVKHMSMHMHVCPYTSLNARSAPAAEPGGWVERRRLRARSARYSVASSGARTRQSGAIVADPEPIWNAAPPSSCRPQAGRACRLEFGSRGRMARTIAVLLGGRSLPGPGEPPSDANEGPGPTPLRPKHAPGSAGRLRVDSVSSGRLSRAKSWAYNMSYTPSPRENRSIRMPCGSCSHGSIDAIVVCVTQLYLLM